MNVMNIRPFQEKDGEAVKTLISDILDQEFQLVKSVYSDTDLNTISKTYSGKRNTFFVGEVDRRIIGTVAVKEDDRETALLRRLFVAPAFRGKDLGSRLVDEALRFCREKGYKKVVFRGTKGMSAASSLMRRKGFREAERIRLGEIEMIRFVLHL